MKNKKIQLIIQKFFENTTTEKEIEQLDKWVKENKSLFSEYVELNYLVKGAVEKEKIEQLKKDLVNSFGVNKTTKKQSKQFQILKYASIFIGILVLCVFYYSQNKTVAKSNQQKITITLEDGSSKEILDTNTSKLISKTNTYVAKQEGTKITYNKVSVKSQGELKPLVFNTLEVPYGKKFQVVLSDGTEIYINSGSSLTYPVAFYENGPRKVTLKGEAYFTVESDSLRPFFVSTESIDTKVLGTEFNITNYGDDEYTKIVLVEGSLSLNKSADLETNSVILVPNQIASYSSLDKSLVVKNANISSYIAWKDGILLFKNEDFYLITKKLERYYNIEINIHGIKIRKEKYTGRFKTETIEEVLQAFQRIKVFEYSINNNKININPKK